VQFDVQAHKGEAEQEHRQGDPVTDYSRLDKYLAEFKGRTRRDSGFQYHEGLTDFALKQFVDKHEFGDVLDVGIGVGYALRKFKARGLRVTGITQEHSEADSAKADGLDARIMDMNFLDFPDSSFDLVWCRHALEHSLMPIIALMEFRRVLRPGGYLYVEVPSDCIMHIMNVDHHSLFADHVWQTIFKKVELKLYFRGQFSTFMQIPGCDPNWGWDDIYWYYWMRKEAQ
jgi:SAM-dependent methyltransferase